VSHWRRLGLATAVLAAVLVVGTAGYVVLGFSLSDAAYQAVTTVSTVGYKEVQPLSQAGRIFTMALILVGVGAAFYTFSVLVETVVEGRLNELLGRRRMEQSIAKLQDHVIICGWGRVGQAIAVDLEHAGKDVVIIELDPELARQADHLTVTGDATDDHVLLEAGVERAAALVAAVDSDAADAFISLSAKALNPDLFIVARARSQDSIDKLRRSGADRVVNPQSLGGSRMAAFVLRPHVSEFIDVVMHERNLEFRLEEIAVTDGSPFAGATVQSSEVRERTGALVLALREEDGTFVSNPAPETTLRPGQVLIAIGTEDELVALERYARG
jgi:voltage-gated potassium channel